MELNDNPKPNPVQDTETKPFPEKKPLYIQRPRVTKPQISYEDILAKMGMFVHNGMLHMRPQNTKTEHKESDNYVPKDSYIYNKYFKDEINNTQPTIRKPQTIEEYKIMVLSDLLQKQRIKQIKSTKLMMPANNISMSDGRSGELNKLFRFPRR